VLSKFQMLLGAGERRNDPNKWNVRVFCLEYG
jgi:hypothetical protein